MLENQGVPRSNSTKNRGTLWQNPRVESYRRHSPFAWSLGLLLTWLSWPIRTLIPDTSVDASWKAGLHIAANEGLKHGRDIVFTHGPLGFLTAPQFYFTRSSLIALAFTFVVHAMICIVIVILALRLFAWPWAVLISFVIARVTGDSIFNFPTAESLTIATLALLIWTMKKDREGWRQIAIPLIVGMIGSLLLLMKFSTGIFVLGTALLLSLAAPKKLRWAGLVGSGFSVGGSALWVIAGQNLTDLGAFLKYSFQLSNGYSAMSIETAGRGWEYIAALVIVIMLGLLTFMADRQPRWSLARTGVALAVALVTFTSFKEGFVRHDTHSIIFFTTCAILGLALAARGDQKRLGAAFIAVAAVAALGAQKQNPSSLFNVFGSARSAVIQLASISTGGGRARLVDDGRTAMARSYGINSSIERQLDGRTVDMDPWDASVAWLYPQIRWRPVPAIQSYTAYTRALDELNAALLRSPRAPELILRRPPSSIDMRYPIFDSPALQLEMRCRYRPIETRGPWQLLSRLPESRCGQARLIRRVENQIGETITIPGSNADMIVFMKVRGFETLALRLMETAFKPPDTSITFDSSDRYRFIPATGEGSLILNLPSQIDIDATFRPRKQMNTLRFDRAMGAVLGQHIEIDFYAVPVDL